jgi:hypothetical protein
MRCHGENANDPKVNIQKIRAKDIIKLLSKDLVTKSYPSQHLTA